MKHIKLAAIVVAAGATLGAGTATARPEPNFIIGTPGNDILPGTRHRDFIIGRRGDDRLIGRAQTDVLLGGPGRDILRAATPLGHSGRDVLRGGLGIDRCVGDSGDTFRGCETIVIRG
jgi:Ca2+-binding RTX toxin-like protein